MQTFIMAADNLPDLTASLSRWGRVWAPVEREDGVFTIEPVERAQEARPDAVTTLLPSKKLLLKPRFVMMDGIPIGCARETTENDAGPQVYLGAHACDIHALKILDKLYLSGIQDPYYARNRADLTVIGHGCWPDEQCFCDSLDTSTVNDGFDLFLAPLEGRYLVTVSSARGDEIVTGNPGLFEPARSEDTREYLEYLRRRKRAFSLEVDLSDLPYILELKK